MQRLETRHLPTQRFKVGALRLLGIGVILLCVVFQFVQSINYQVLKSAAEPNRLSPNFISLAKLSSDTVASESRLIVSDEPVKK